MTSERKMSQHINKLAEKTKKNKLKHVTISELMFNYDSFFVVVVF